MEWYRIGTVSASDIAKAVVEEFRDFLAEYHAELVHPEMKITGNGIAVEMPKAAADPQKVSEVHPRRVFPRCWFNELVGTPLVITMSATVQVVGRRARISRACAADRS